MSTLQAIDTLIKTAQKIAPWVSASLSELPEGHTGEYEKDAEAFLAAILYWRDYRNENY